MTTPLSDTQPSTLAKIFGEIDRNKDAVIDLDEARQAARDADSFHTAGKTFIDLFDVDRGGTVSQGELGLKLFDMLARLPPRAQTNDTTDILNKSLEWFGIVDSNRDSSISVDELAPALVMAEVGNSSDQPLGERTTDARDLAQLVTHLVDTNGNGAVGRDEFAHLVGDVVSQPLPPDIGPFIRSQVYRGLETANDAKGLSMDEARFIEDRIKASGQSPVGTFQLNIAEEAEAYVVGNAIYAKVIRNDGPIFGDPPPFRRNTWFKIGILPS